MKCAEGLEWISEYADMPVDDPQRIVIDQHLAECETCVEQFAVWSASMHWMVDEGRAELDTEPAGTLTANRVMDRIYDEQQWLMPVGRSHVLSLRSRHVIAGIIAFCMAMFFCALIFLLIRDEQSNVNGLGGLVPAALAGDNRSGLGTINIELPVASSVSEPAILRVGPTIPHYWIALSLFGITFALLLLNWLTRVRQ